MRKFTTTPAIIYLLIAVVIPFITLSVLGLVFLANQALLLTVLIVWLVCSGFGYLFLVLWSSHREKQLRQLANANSAVVDQAIDGLPAHLEPGTDWTDKDRQVWQSACTTIKQQLESNPDWETTPELALSLLSEVSAHYNSSGAISESKFTDLKYRFTVPEMLLVLNVTSERYREVVLSHVPFAERVNVSTLLAIFENQKKIKQGYTWINRARRIIRLGNPVAAAIGELRDQFTDRVFNQLSTSVQLDLKRLLLQEVAQVAIELYSGKLKSSSQELKNYSSSGFKEDNINVPENVEPLRVMLVGQSSSGKSSLINAFADTLSAEVDTLPTTDSQQTHVLQLAPNLSVNMIDTVGLDGSEQQILDVAASAINADIIVFVARANQPARNADKQLHSAINTVLASKPERKAAPMLLVLTHVDQLTPRSEWQPPYDLQSEAPKARQISLALQSSIEQIGLPEDIGAIPVCLSIEKENYNIDAVAAQILSLQDSAILAQWNRRRVERGEQSIPWKKRWSQVKNLGQVAGRLLVKKS